MITPNTPVKITIVVVCSLIGFGWAGAAAWGAKADKDDVAALQTQVNALVTQRAVDAKVQENILELLKRMDSRMERMEDKQDYAIKEIIKGNQDHLPPRGENPLNR